MNENIKLEHIKKLFYKYGYTHKEVQISMNHFHKYIENGLKVNYLEWIESNSLDKISKYLDYYQTH